MVGIRLELTLHDLGQSPGADVLRDAPERERTYDSGTATVRVRASTRARDHCSPRATAEFPRLGPGRLSVVGGAYTVAGPANAKAVLPDLHSCKVFD